MGLLKSIKDFFTRNKTKALPEASSTYENYSNPDTNNSWIIGNGYVHSTEPISKIDIDINNFLTAYYNNVAQIDSYMPINNYKVAYQSLVQSNETVTQEQYNFNGYMENQFFNNLPNSNYTAQEENGFYHIRTQGYQLPNVEDMARVYVECNSGNIANLAQLITQVNGNPNFYMKFVSNQANAQGPRNEKLVIYCNKNEIDYTLEMLQNCKDIRPELFNETQGLPFLKKERDIATVAYQPETNEYKNLYGQSKIIPQSVNAFMANILEESYMETVREIARADENLGFLVDQNNYYNETLYVQNYPYILQNYTSYLLNSMKAKMEVLSRSNNIAIEGIRGMETRGDNYYQRDTTNFERY